MDIKLNDRYVLEKTLKLLEKNTDNIKDSLKEEVSLALTEDCEIVSESEAKEIIQNRENCIVGVKFLDTKKSTFYLFSSSDGALPVKFTKKTEILDKDALINEIIKTKYADSLLTPKLENKKNLLSGLGLKAKANKEEIMSKLHDVVEGDNFKSTTTKEFRMKNVTPAQYTQMLLKDCDKKIKKQIDSTLEFLATCFGKDALDTNSIAYMENSKKLKVFLDEDYKSTKSSEEILHELVNKTEEFETKILSECVEKSISTGLYSIIPKTTFEPKQEDFFFKFSHKEVLDNPIYTFKIDTKELSQLLEKGLVEFENANLIKGGTTVIYKPILDEVDLDNSLSVFETIHTLMCSDTSKNKDNPNKKSLDDIDFSVSKTESTTTQVTTQVAINEANANAALCM